MGEIAALITAFLWACSAILFTFAGKRIGSLSLNRLRLSFALIFLGITHWIVFGMPIPITASPQQWFWLGLSSIFGLVIGDLFLYKAYILIGPRITMVIMSIVPVMSALFARIFLQETLSLQQWAGIFLTIIGIVIVLLDRDPQKRTPQTNREQILGLLFTLGGAFGQATGLIFAKKGLVNHYPALSGVVIRIFIAVITVWLMAIFTKQVKRTYLQIKQDPQALKFTVMGSFVGPFLGVWLSLVSVQLAKVGIASTLMALTPIFHLPIAKYILKEEINLKAISGTIIAMFGIVIIFL